MNFSIPMQKNYKLIENNCLCGKRNDIFLSKTDRQ